MARVLCLFFTLILCLFFLLDTAESRQIARKVSRNRRDADEECPMGFIFNTAGNCIPFINDDEDVSANPVGLSITNVPDRLKCREGYVYIKRRQRCVRSSKIIKS